MDPGFDFSNYTHTCKTLAVSSSAAVIKYLSEGKIGCACFEARTKSQSTVAGKPQQQGM